MASAREQIANLIDTFERPMSLEDGQRLRICHEAADEASDVWEPIVRDLVEAFEYAPNYVRRSHPARAAHMREMLQKAKEALGA